MALQATSSKPAGLQMDDFPKAQKKPTELDGG
jgi:hypothetical protein